MLMLLVLIVLVLPFLVLLLVLLILFALVLLLLVLVPTLLLFPLLLLPLLLAVVGSKGRVHSAAIVRVTRRGVTRARRCVERCHDLDEARLTRVKRQT